MYKSITKKYKKKRTEHRFDKFYILSTIPLGVVFLILTHFFDNKLVFCFIMGVVICLLVIAYYINDVKKYLTKSELKGRLKNKIALYLNYLDEKDNETLVKLLKEYNIGTPDKIKLIIDYYSYKLPNYTQNTILNWIWGICVGLYPLIMFAYNEKTKTININDLINIIIQIIIIVFPIILLPVIVKIIVDQLNKRKENIYDELVSKLTYIYINFDKYKNKLK